MTSDPVNEPIVEYGDVLLAVAIECATAPTDASIRSVIDHVLRELSGALGATFAECWLAGTEPDNLSKEPNLYSVELTVNESRWGTIGLLVPHPPNDMARIVAALGQIVNAYLSRAVGLDPTIQQFPPILLQSSECLVYAKDLAGRVTMANWRVRDLLGEAEIVGNTLFGSQPAHLTKAIGDSDDLVITTGRTALVTEVAEIDGRQRRFFTLKSPMIDEAGEVYGIGCVSTEVTDRETGDSDYRTAIQRRDAVGVVDTGVVILTLTGEFFSVGPYLAGLLGYNVEDLVGKNVQDITDPEWRFLSAGLFEQVAAGLVDRGSLVTLCRSREGRPVWLQVISSLISDSDGTPLQFLAVVSDFTGPAFHDEESKRSDKLDAVADLAGAVAHDVNNQLGGIVGYSELIAAKLNVLAANDPELAQMGLVGYCREITATALRIGDFTNQLMSFSRMTNMKNTQVDVNVLVTRVIEIVGQSAGPSIDIQSQLGEELPLVDGDRNQLQTALLSVADNARDAMPHGGTISFSTQMVSAATAAAKGGRPVDSVLIEVSDTGPGMSKEVLRRAFDPFFSTKATDKGRGLGLAAVYRTAQAHEGRVLINSELGDGTTLSMFLPASALSEPVGPDQHEAPETVEACVLVVDDDVGVRTAITDMLEMAGFVVIAAEDGEAGLATYREHREKIDLVLFDMIMPKMDGREMVTRIRELNPNLRSVLVSGYGEGIDVDALRSAGTTEVVAKPFTMDSLVSATRRALGAATTG